ncbi:hypothetical protein KC317_g16865, partial [Hortaea werneckii]
MLLLDYQNVLIESLLRDRLAPESVLFPARPSASPANPPTRATPTSIDQIVSDFDNVTFHISTPESKSKILISITI